MQSREKKELLSTKGEQKFVQSLNYKKEKCVRLKPTAKPASFVVLRGALESTMLTKEDHDSNSRAENTQWSKEQRIL